MIETLPEIIDSIVVHLDGAGRDELVLLVQVAPDVVFNAELQARLAVELRASLSPRHVPDAIYRVDAIPRTHSGKKLEVPVKRFLANPVERK